MNFSIDDEMECYCNNCGNGFDNPRTVTIKNENYERDFVRYSALGGSFHVVAFDTTNYFCPFCGSIEWTDDDW